MADPPTAASKLRRRGDVAAVEVEQETILYDPGAQLLHHLDRIATVVWRDLDGGRPLADLVGDLAAVYEADEHMVERDVLALAGQLLEDGLVHVVEDR